jgi:hypothetical protein
MSGGGGQGGILTQYVLPGLEAVGGAVSEYFAPGNPIGTSLLGSGVGQLAGGAAGGSQGQGIGGLLGGLGGGLGGSIYSGGSGSGGLSSLGGLGSMLGGGPQSGTAQPQFAPPFQSSGGVGTTPLAVGAGTAPMGTGSFGGWGSLADGTDGTTPPSPALSPSGGGATGTAPNPNLSPAGGGPATLASTSPATTGQQPSLLQTALGASGSASQAYANYISQMNQLKYRPEYASEHSSPVIAPQLNPLAPIQSSPIAPPQLQV